MIVCTFIDYSYSFRRQLIDLSIAIQYERNIFGIEAADKKRASDELDECILLYMACSLIVTYV